MLRAFRGEISLFQAIVQRMLSFQYFQCLYFFKFSPSTQFALTLGSKFAFLSSYSYMCACFDFSLFLYNLVASIFDSIVASITITSSNNFHHTKLFVGCPHLFFYEFYDVFATFFLHSSWENFFAVYSGVLSHIISATIVWWQDVQCYAMIFVASIMSMTHGTSSGS